jgi:hypothetical protein
MAAGQGFKTFATGDVLTAPDVNGYLMQGVLVFATAAARTSAITSPQQGQVSFLKDTNSTEYYSGSVWVAIGGGGGSSITTATFRDEKASGVAGGTFTSGAWRTRDLNTSQFNNITSASLASNQITLPAGTYTVNLAAPVYDIGGHQARFYNITDSTTAVLGISNYLRTGATATSMIGVASGAFTITGAKVFEFQQQCDTTKATFGYGFPDSFGTEVYATITIIKVA